MSDHRLFLRLAALVVAGLGLGITAMHLWGDRLGEAGGLLVALAVLVLAGLVWDRWVKRPPKQA